MIKAVARKAFRLTKSYSLDPGNRVRAMFDYGRARKGDIGTVISQGKHWFNVKLDRSSHGCQVTPYPLSAWEDYPFGPLVGIKADLVSYPLAIQAAELNDVDEAFRWTAPEKMAGHLWRRNIETGKVEWFTDGKTVMAERFAVLTGDA